jgi:hypothetical protein
VGSDRVFVSWSAAGTNLGRIGDRPPSGARTEFAGVTLLTFDADGKICESQVWRQAPADEAAYFLGQRQADGGGQQQEQQQQLEEGKEDGSSSSSSSSESGSSSSDDG